MKLITYILISLTFLFVSCEDFIDIEPEDKIGMNDYFKTSRDVENYVKKFYNEFPTHGSASQPLQEINSDNLIVNSPDQVLNGSRTTRTGNWINEWSQIRSINILFDNLERVESTYSEYKHFVGEAYFFRAWFYFILLEQYGDLPIYKQQLFPEDKELLNARVARDEVVRFILEDLDNAIENLNLISQTGNATLNKETALAFKAQVALFEGTWQKYHQGTAFGTKETDPNYFLREAVTASEELIYGDFPIELYSTGNTDKDYYALFGMDNMSNVNEVLFHRIANSSENLGHELQLYTIERTAQMGVTWSLVSSYLNKEGLPYDYKSVSSSYKGNDFLIKIANDCDPRLKSTIWIPGDLRVNNPNSIFNKPYIDRSGEEICPTGFQVKKFSNPYSTGAGQPYGGKSETGRIYFRIAEVLLIYAEAKYELDGVIAFEELNLLRDRVGLPKFRVIPQSEYGSNLINYGYEIDDALYAIRNERRVELALEGQRVNDYRRWAAHELFQNKRPIGYPFKKSEFPDFGPDLTDDLKLDFFKKDLPNGYQFRPKQDYLRSIPKDELVLNPNLQQNPGWN